MWSYLRYYINQLKNNSRQEEVAEWSMATDCKSVSFYSRWFESSLFQNNKF